MSFPRFALLILLPILLVGALLMWGTYEWWQAGIVDYCRHLGYSGAWTNPQGAWGCQ